MKNKNNYRLNPDEEVIGGSDVESVVFDRGGFLLTNQRVIKVDRTPFGGQELMHSFTLENLDSVCTYIRRHHILWIIGVLGLVGTAVFVKDGSWNRDQKLFTAIISCSVSIGFILAYFANREKLIILHSGRSEMILNVMPWSFEKIQELVFEVEQAKQLHLNSLQAPERGDPSRNSKQRLEHLKELLSSGTITQEEYSYKRRSILEEL